MDHNFHDTSYDVTVVATQKLKDQAYGTTSAAGGAGTEARQAYASKVKKYESVFKGPRAQRRVGSGLPSQRWRRFEPLVFESSGYAHAAVKSLVCQWEKAARARMSPGRWWSPCGSSTRRQLSTVVHYWNAVSIARRAGVGLRVGGAGAVGGLQRVGVAGRLL